MASWIARRYRFERELDRLYKEHQRMLRDPGVPVSSVMSDEEIKLAGLKPHMMAGWGGSAPLSYQSELADDRTRAAKRLAGMRNPDRGNYEEFAHFLISCGVVGLAGGAIGGLAGYILSEDHPVLMTLGGTATGGIGASLAFGLSAVAIEYFGDKIYERAINKHREKLRLRSSDKE